MNELNDKELEQVVGGAAGFTGGSAGGFSGGSKNATNNTKVTSTILPHSISTTASNDSNANGFGSHAAGGASSFAGGVVL